MKKLISKILTIALSLVTFLGLVLDKFVEAKVDTVIGTSKPTFYNFTEWFDYITDFVELKELTWMPIAQYLIYGALVFAGITIILVALQFFIKNKNLNTFVVTVSVVDIAIGLVTLLSLVLGIKELNDYLSTSIASIQYSLQLAAYIVPLGAILGGAFGLTATNSVKSKSKKRR